MASTLSHMLFLVGIIALGCAVSSVSAVSEDEVSQTASNIWEDIKNMRVTEIKRSALACPLPLVGVACAEETPLYHFQCCGELNGSCCFRLQDWVIAVLAIMTILVILSIFVNLIRCLCCY
uniref:Uncharacterized protein n=1 Tax=Panagrellus redivivus TaxID=6233 RepID=A0A7E4UXT1_PANRE